MSKYNPLDPNDRCDLGDAMIAKMTEAGFTEEFPAGTTERVFSREVPNTDGKIRVAVYTTVVGTEARNVGRDSIKVVALYKARGGRDRGIVKDRRVNRVGEVGAICERAVQRMRDSWKAVRHTEKCHCGSPKFTSKKGNLCCADLCWKSDNEMSHPAPRSDGWSNRSRYAQGRRTANPRMNRATGTANIDFAWEGR